MAKSKEEKIGWTLKLRIILVGMHLIGWTILFLGAFCWGIRQLEITGAVMIFVSILSFCIMGLFNSGGADGNLG